MAIFTPSNLLTAQAMVIDRYKAPENRVKPSPVLALGLRNQAILIPSHLELRKREDRAVKAFLLARTKRATTASRLHNHTGNRGDSFEQTLSWTIYADKFSISLKQLDNNLFDFNTTLSHQLENSMKNILSDIETALVTNLLSEKTEINAATYNGTFNAAYDTFEISSEARFYQHLKSMMRQNDYNTELDVIANSIAFSNAEFQRNQGSGNSSNTNFQFNGMEIVESYELTDANYTTSDLVLAMPKGAFGVLPWIPKQNRIGQGDYNSYVGGFGTIKDPFGLGLDIAVHGYSDRADTSASNGNSQDVVMQFELSVDIAPAIAPLSVATETPIFQAARV